MPRPARLLFVATLSALSVLGGAAFAGQASFLLDAQTGKVLQASNENELNYPASLTKMMTLYLTFQALHDGRLSWDQRLTMSANAESKEPYKLAVGVGRKVTVKEAVDGIIVLSANDAAVALAEQLAGSEEAFARLMTQKAHELGMTSTVFRNPSGLPDPQQVTTARDMATLGLALANDFPEEFKLFSMRGFQFRGMKLRGHNNLMYRYDGVDGIKTGFTDASGYNIVTSASKDNRRVIGVVMGGKTADERDRTMAGLLDAYLPQAADSPGLTATSGEKSATLADPSAPRKF
jgi:D-alanyl-D-alanine carboxypeptidase (penicillin-binding protein 5/6)